MSKSLVQCFFSLISVLHPCSLQYAGQASSLPDSNSLFTSQRFPSPLGTTLSTVSPHTSDGEGGSCTCACSCMLESNRCRRVSPALLSHSSSSPRSGLFSGVSISRRTCRAVTQHVPILSDLVSGSADRSRTNAHSLILKWVVSL